MNKLFKLIQLIIHGYFPILLRTKVAAGIEHTKVLAPLNCKHVVDIGGNRGQFALVARKCFPQAKIDSFEPLSEPAACFQSVFYADPNTKLHRLAIGSKEEDVEIHISSRDDSSSLLPITETQSTLFPGTGECSTRIIHVAPLKSVLSENEIQEPALLKIDVQGFELEVLYGCEELIEKFRYLYVECSFVELYEGQALADEVISFLHERHYILNGVYNLCYDIQGKAVQADFFFILHKE